jgi:hypothetical protein
MALTYQDIAARVEAGETAEQIATALAASGVTVRPIDLSELRYYLRDSGLLVRGIDRPFEGGLVAVARSTSAPAALRSGLVDLITHVYDDSKATLSTDTPEIAARGSAMLAGLVQLGVMTPEQRTGFYSLGGGLRFADVTSETVQAAIDAQTAQEARNALSARLVAGASAGALAIEQGGDLASVRAAMLSAFDGSAA